MKTKLEAAAALKVLQPFIGRSQMACLAANCRGEEKQFFFDKLCEYAERVRTMPKTYEQENKGKDAIAYLHYFTSGSDHYITEKDSCAGLPGAQHTDYEPGQHQAFGSANLGYGTELGYISIVELLECGAELDLYFTPKTLAELDGEDQPAGEKSSINNLSSTINNPEPTPMRFNPITVVEAAPSLPSRPSRAAKPRPKREVHTRPRQKLDAHEALQRAINGLSLVNYPAIFAGFLAKGIPEANIKPRENIFTFGAWLAQGRAVRRGEKGVRIATAIPIGEPKVDPATGEVDTTGVRTRPWHSTVFHISQTEPKQGMKHNVRGMKPAPTHDSSPIIHPTNIPVTFAPAPASVPAVLASRPKPAWLQRRSAHRA